MPTDCRHLARCSRVVAGQQNGREPESPHLGDGCGAVAFHGVRDRQDAAGDAVPGDRDDRAPTAFEVGRRIVELRGHRDAPVRRQPSAAADGHQAPVDDRLHAEPLRRRERFERGQRADAVGRGGRDGSGDRMLRPGLDRAGEAKELIGVFAPGGDHVGQRSCGPW